MQAQTKILANVQSYKILPQYSYIAVLLACLILILMAEPLMAQTDTAMGDALCAIVKMVWGNLGRGLATLAIIVVGIGATLGKTSWGLALTVATGIAVIFNAGTLAANLNVGAGNC